MSGTIDEHVYGPVRLHLYHKDRAGLATITLSDPRRRNALGPAMFDGLETTILQLEALTAATRFHPFHQAPPSDAVRVIILQAEGSSFCAGFDIALLVDDPDQQQPLLASFLRRLAGCVRRLRALPAVSIASVQGSALAGGCALAAACDLAVASPDARFGYPTHAIGLSPAVSGPVLNARVGSGSTRSMLLGGTTMDATAALRCGLVCTCAPSNESLAEIVMEMACKLLNKAPHALAATKRWLQDLDHSIDPTNAKSALDASLITVGSDDSRRMLREGWLSRQKN